MKMAYETTLRFGLGIDAGGTATRWAIVDEGKRVIARGDAPPMSGVQLHSAAGPAQLDAALRALANALDASGNFNAARDAHHTGVLAGVTGLGDADAPAFGEKLRAALSIAHRNLRVISDIALLCECTYAPGEGIIVYAGTGSIAAHLDTRGTLQRAGGRGVHLDDGGGGYWIAREALREIWRREDEAPGAWQKSALARAVFDHIGDASWDASRAFFYSRERGEVAALAPIVASVANHDAPAMVLLKNAAHELARLAQAMHSRYGVLPTQLRGGVTQLHPSIRQHFVSQLPDGCVRTALNVQLPDAAAHRALGFQHPIDS